MRYDGLTEEELARRLGVPLLRLLDTVGSTLDVAHELGAAGAPHGAVVVAAVQTAGRGRQGRRWHSPRGGVWLSLLLRPAQPPVGGALALRAGMAARDALQAVLPGHEPRIKWPNDIILGGRKVGGVLCEASWSGGTFGWVCVGVGINVKGPQQPEAEIRETALFLDSVAPQVTRLGILLALVPRLAPIGDTPATLTEAERHRFRLVCWVPPDGDGPDEVDPDGALIVRRADGTTERRVAPD